MGTLHQLRRPRLGDGVAARLRQDVWLARVVVSLDVAVLQDRVLRRPARGRRGAQADAKPVL